MQINSRIANVKCEYKKNPIGLGVKKPRFSYQIESDLSEVMQLKYRILISSNAENINNNIGDLWDSGEIHSTKTLQIEYEGSKLLSRQICYYKILSFLNTGEVLESEINTFEMGLLNRRDFTARMIKYRPDGPAVGIKGEFAEGSALPMLRKTFTVCKDIERVRIYSTALGIYMQKINGMEICNDRLTPGWSNYDKELFYQTYDITKYINKGNNCISAVLADGWYAGCIGLFGREFYGSAPMGYYCQLEITYKDNTTETIMSDSTWKYSFGAYQYADLLIGEYYDATKEIENWELPEFDDASWNNAIEYLYSASPLHGDFTAQIAPPVQIIEELKPLSIKRIGENKYIVDMGQNMVGVTRLKVREKRGIRVVQRFGEMLNEDCSLYTDNLRNARATDIYVCKGSEEEIIEPLFTFHGFRYVEVSGLENEPQLSDITGCVLCSSMEITGHIKTGDELVNKLFSNVLWGNKGNFIDVPTDCPQRDERLGWSGDVNIFCKTACYNMDSAAFFTKWLLDLEYSQRLDGSYSDVAPYVNICATAIKHTKNADGGNAVWADSGIFVPYALFEAYEDTAVLRAHYNGMEKYMEFLEDESDNYIRADRGYGDWLSVGENTENSLVGTAYYCQNAYLMSKISAVLGKDKEKEKYLLLHQNIKEAFINKFVDKSTGKIEGDTQTGYLLALKFRILEGELKEWAVKRLAENIERHNKHLTSGFVGVSYLLPVLTESGYESLAYDLLLQKTYPSWLYSVVNGATTIWERWNSYTKESGFGDVGMNSFNHYSLGSVSEWLYSYVGGIRPKSVSMKFGSSSDSFGYRLFEIAPVTDERLGYASVSYNSSAGRIVSEWEYGDKCINYSFHIPANTVCCMEVKAGSILKTNIPDTRLEINNNKLMAELLSGDYTLTVGL